MLEQRGPEVKRHLPRAEELFGDAEAGRRGLRLVGCREPCPEPRSLGLQPSGFAAPQFEHADSSGA